MSTAGSQAVAASPSSTIPTLSMPKARNAAPKTPESSRIPSAPQSVSKIAQRIPSRPAKLGNVTNGDQARSTPTVPTLRSTSNAAQALSLPGGDVRRSVSIASFPQPPKVRSRLDTNPRSSPSTTWPTLENNLRDSEDPDVRGILGEGLRVKKLKTKTSLSSLSLMYTNLQSPTLLNGTRDGRSVKSTEGNRTSDGINSLHSPAHSRNSSAQDSYSTSATTFEDIDENARRGRDGTEDDKIGRKSSSTNRESKGNVIVSVRVRPDVAGNGDTKSEGEWLVDGRRSLISYRGREGGNYYYGISFASFRLSDTDNDVQITFSQSMIRTTKCTMLPQKD